MMKRLTDIVVGVIATIITLPIVAVLMVVSAMSFRARPWFVQERIGVGGRRFRLVKVRSLPPSADPAADKYQIAQVRTTRFGTFVRRTHLDELPQLWSVVSGSMSLVGPRPEMPHLADRFGPEQRAARECFRPGCVGLWQASEHNGGLMYEHPEYDRFYADHHGVGLDAYVVWRTLVMELGGPRLRLSDVPTRLRRDRSPMVADLPVESVQ